MEKLPENNRKSIPITFGKTVKSIEKKFSEADIDSCLFEALEKTINSDLTEKNDVINVFMNGFRKEMLRIKELQDKTTL